MATANCRCGQVLTVSSPSERVVCPKCGARVRIRVRPDEAPADGFIRFDCPCGRRLKVPAEDRPTHGKCPDCGRVVPVPRPAAQANLPPGHPETPTADLSPADIATLERWSRDHMARASSAGIDPSTARLEGLPNLATTTTQADVLAVPNAPVARVEVGLRTCPRCHKPVHLQAEVCHACGAPVPRR